MRHRVWILAAFLLTGCAHIPTASDRAQHAASIANEAGWHQQIISTDSFDLVAFTPRQAVKAGTLIVYIEGDGLAWINRSTPSLNPTPIHPIALQLALSEPETAVYLARPCQYVSGEHWRNCSAKQWTSHRFSPEVIDASNMAVDKLEQQFGASKLVLVGYSGGGAIATLIAAKRSDVIRLITIAGNLDTAAWAHLHRISPLTGSLNPADFWQSLQHIPQIHYVGDDDTTVPQAVAHAYTARFPSENKPAIELWPGFNHRCCWLNVWRGANKKPEN